MRVYVVLLLLFISSCASGPQTPHSDIGQAPESQPVQESFEFVGGHMTVFPVVVAGTRRRFILDTGIGVSLISETLCAELQCTITDSFQGKRMSGQVVDVKLAQIGAMSLAGHRQEQSTVGVIDMDRFIPKSVKIDGFLSLNFFENTPFTLDYNSQTLTVETDSSMKDIANVGHELTINVTRDGPSLSVFMPMSVASKKLRLEVDTGSASLILHERYAEALKVDLGGDKVRRVEGQDETNNSYTRYFAQVAGPVYAFDLPQITQENLQIMFQDIIYDGLVGKSFLSQFRVTFDLPARRMIFRTLSSSPSGTAI